MRKVIVGEYYRHRDTPNYAWAKVIEILEPNQHPNTTRSRIARCEWVVNKGDTTGLIKYFKLSDLTKDKTR